MCRYNCVRRIIGVKIALLGEDYNVIHGFDIVNAHGVLKIIFVQTGQHRPCVDNACRGSLITSASTLKRC